MPMLFERLQAKAKSTVAYPMHEPWLDVGKPEDLLQANTDIDQLDAKVMTMKKILWMKGC